MTHQLTEKDPEMKGKTLCRIEAITTLQNSLEQCLKGKEYLSLVYSTQWQGVLRLNSSIFQKLRHLSHRSFISTLRKERSHPLQQKQAAKELALETQSISNCLSYLTIEVLFS